MAKRVDTTVPPLTEPPVGGLRAMFARFTALIGALIDLAAAERDLGDYAGGDPALAAYTGAVDAARARTLAHCAIILAGESVDEMARGMQRVAGLIRTAVTTASADEVAMIRNLCGMRTQTVFFRIYTPGRPGYNAMMERALDALAAYAAGPGTSVGHDLEGKVAVAHSAMSQRFNRLVGAMAQVVAAEQAIQRPVAGDVLGPRFGAAMDDAEAALSAMHNALRSVIAADLSRDADRALWNMGYALHILVDRSEDDARLAFFDLMMEYQEFFMVPGGTAVARRTREMQMRYFRLLDQMMQLEDFGGPGPDGDGAFGPVLAA